LDFEHRRGQFDLHSYYELEGGGREYVTIVFFLSLHFSLIDVVGIPSYYLASVRHLLVKENADAGLGNVSVEKSILGACAKVLSLDIEDIETNIPLSSYGLDSLTSVRLSGILKQHFDTTVTQLQLLGIHITGTIPVFR
jgi:fatty acid synthase, animal type